MRDLITLIENAEVSESPVVKFKTIGPKWKDIYIDGVKVGFVSKDSQAVGVGLHGGANGSNTRKMVLWTGDFTFDGTKFSIGRTEKASELKAKIERLIRSHQVRKANPED